MFLALALMAVGATCASDPVAPADEENDVREMSHLVTGLKPGTTYHWKLLVQPAGGEGFSSESITYSFTTSE